MLLISRIHDGLLKLLKRLHSNRTEVEILFLEAKKTRGNRHSDRLKSSLSNRLFIMKHPDDLIQITLKHRLRKIRQPSHLQHSMDFT